MNTIFQDSSSAEVNVVLMVAVAFQALWMLAFFRRDKAIGGPLLVLFAQVFANAVLSLLLLVGIFIVWQRRDLSATSALDDRMMRVGLLFALASVAANAFTAIAAVVLLKTRRRQPLVYLRCGLGAVAALAVAALLHHVSVSTFLDVIFPLVFLPYLFLSNRVRRAFRKPEPLVTEAVNQ
jgi:hypothetical protein